MAMSCLGCQTEIKKIKASKKTNKNILVKKLTKPSTILRNFLMTSCLTSQNMKFFFPQLLQSLTDSISDI